MVTVVKLGEIHVAIYPSNDAEPYFHLVCGRWSAWIAIETFEVIAGDVPKNVYEVAIAWAANHKTLLRRMWAELNDRN